MDNVKGRKFAILIAEGVNDILLYTAKQEIEMEGGEARVISLQLGFVKASNRKKIAIDYSLCAVSSDLFDALYIPGGRKSIEYLMKQKEALHFICTIYTSGKNIAIDEECIQLLETACFNPSLSSLSLNELKSNGIFVQTKNVPVINSFIKAVVGDYTLGKAETSIKMTATKLPLLD